MKVAVYVMSCDKTSDVLEHFMIGLKKYWNDCLFNIYIGTNSIRKDYGLANIKYIPVERSNWRDETLEQLAMLQTIDSEITHLIVFLDDFVLNGPISNDRVMNIVKYGKLNEIKYLRLKRLEEGLIRKCLQYFLKKIRIKNELIFEIRKTHPYFSSLQVCLWELKHLKFVVEQATDIWNFELFCNSSVKHYSVIDNIVNYRHIVEKGKWEIYAKEYCENNIGFFTPGKRLFRARGFIYSLKYFYTHSKFVIFGYSIMTLKKYFK